MGMERMNKTIVKNVLLEMCVLILIGLLLNLHFVTILVILFEFMMVRSIFGFTKCDMNYESMITTVFLITSIFLIVKVDVVIALITTFFVGKILSQENLNFRWKNIWKEGFMYKSSKYDKMVRYIELNEQTDEVKEFESRLEKYSPKAYEFYNMRIKQKMKYREIEEKMKCDNRKITDQLNVAFSNFNVYFDLKDE